MSEPGASGIPSSGVTRNSALSFLTESASAQIGNDEVNTSSNQGESTGNVSERAVPSGLKALCTAYSGLYPDQPNPLQVTTRLKYWLGGHDPLDYISMYWNAGKPELNVPPHWHYVSFGLSDLHGDGRVHAPPDRTGAVGQPSGFGLELTLRLASGGPQPPLWPAALLQALARYMFTTGNKFYAGDHITWHAPLDGDQVAKSRVRHLLVAADPQLPTIQTPHGTVMFLQIVGCTGRELRAVQRGSCEEVLKKISEDSRVGASAFLLTRVSRRRSAKGVRTLQASAAALAGVSAAICWRVLPQSTNESQSPPEKLPENVEQNIKDTLQRGLTSMSTDRTGPEGHMSTDSFEMSSIERALPEISEPMQGSWRDGVNVEYLPGVHLIFNAEGASLLPLAINGRLAHGHHFTWRNSGSPKAITLVPPGLNGAIVRVSAPYAVKSHWLQVMIPKPLAEDMSKKFSVLTDLGDTDSETDSEDDGTNKPKETPVLPTTFWWPEYNIKITVVQELGYS